MEPWQPIPEWSLLAPYAHPPHYTDHFCISVSAEVTVEQLTAAFFSSRVFRLERFLLNRVFPDKATDGAPNGTTDLYLGSAVLGAYERSIAARVLRATLAPHRTYSRALLRSGKSKLIWAR